MNNRINKIFVLDDNKKYLVINQAMYKNESYLLLNEVNEEENEILTDVMIVREVIEPDGAMSVEIVKDPTLLQLLAKYLPPTA